MRVSRHNASYKAQSELPFCQLGPITPDSRDHARFWSKVWRTDTCWLWTGALFGGHRHNIAKKYGQFGIGSAPNRTSIGAHVFSYVVAHGPIPEGQQVRHTCDNAHCVRPDHLIVGTFKQNMEDAAERGRLHTARPRRHKITPQQIDEIRVCLRAGETQYRVADRYGITSAYAGRLAKGLARQFDAPLAAPVEQAV